MDDLVTFLRAALDDDERVALAASTWTRDWSSSADGVYGSDNSHIVAGAYDVPDPEYAVHIARHDPARVLRDVAAKRAIVDSCEHALVDDGYDEMARYFVQVLAAVYADRPGYRPEWAPDG